MTNLEHLPENLVKTYNAYEILWSLRSKSPEDVFTQIKPFIEQNILSSIQISNIISLLTSPCPKKLIKVYNFIELLNKNYPEIKIKDNKIINSLRRLQNADLTNEETKASLLDIYPKDSLQYAILFDDLDRFIYYTNSRPKFNMQDPIDISYYDSSITHDKIIDLCAYFGSINCFKYIIANHPILRHTFQCACIGGNLEIVRLITQSDPEFLQSSLNYAIMYHNNEIDDWLLENYDIKYKLYHAALGGNYLYIDRLINDDNIPSDFFKFDCSILAGACALDDYEMAKFALEHGGYPHTNDDINPLFQAIYSGSLRMVKLVYEFDSPTRFFEEFGSPLGAALSSGHFDIAEYLLEKGAKINGDGEFSIPIFDVLETQKPELLIKTLELGADPNATNPQGITCLMWAAGQKKKELYDILIEHKSDYTKKCNGVTALYFSAWQGCEEVIEDLLSKGLNINDKDDRGRTALYYVAIDLQTIERVNRLEFLISHGADPTVELNGNLITIDENFINAKRQELE